jgi:hypothetical protein
MSQSRAMLVAGENWWAKSCCSHLDGRRYPSNQPRSNINRTHPQSSSDELLVASCMTLSRPEKGRFETSQRSTICYLFADDSHDFIRHCKPAQRQLAFCWNFWSWGGHHVHLPLPNPAPLESRMARMSNQQAPV